MNWDVWAIIAGFIGGAIITVIATLLVVKWQRQHKELSYRVEVRPFIAPEEPERPGVKWDSNVRILYKDKEVSQLFPFRISFRNTGNQTLQDLRVRLRSNAGAEILNLIIGHPGGIEVGGVQYSLTKPEEWEFQVGFLNERDQIEAYGIGTSDNAFKLTVTVPQPGVRCRNRPEFWSSGEAVRRVLKILAQALVSR